MSRFVIEPTPITGLQVIQRQPISDDRGCFERMFCTEELQSIIEERQLVQINRTKTLKTGAMRGLHFQHPPHAEMKLVSCLRGKVFDVVVDLRHNSPTFLRWHAEILSEDNHRAIAIPEGFAHGFQTLTDNCELLYFHTAEYQPRAEAGINALDNRLLIKWPLPITECSSRDQNHPLLSDKFVGLKL